MRTYTGSGNSVYASGKNLYVAATNYDYSPMNFAATREIRVPSVGMWTVVIKFALNDGMHACCVHVFVISLQQGKRECHICFLRAREL